MLHSPFTTLAPVLIEVAPPHPVRLWVTICGQCDLCDHVTFTNSCITTEFDHDIARNMLRQRCTLVHGGYRFGELCGCSPQ